MHRWDGVCLTSMDHTVVRRGKLDKWGSYVMHLSSAIRLSRPIIIVDSPTSSISYSHLYRKLVQYNDQVSHEILSSEPIHMPGGNAGSQSYPSRIDYSFQRCPTAANSKASFPFVCNVVILLLLVSFICLTWEMAPDAKYLYSCTRCLCGCSHFRPVLG